MEGGYEERCRRLLRAYPPRYRAARERELLSTLLEAAEPGRARPSWRESWDVVRGGLVTRWRTGPPPHRRVAHTVGVRLPDRWRYWVRDDLLGRWYPVRLLLYRMLYSAIVAGCYLLVVIAPHGVTGSELSQEARLLPILPSFGVISVLGVCWRGAAKALGRYGFAPDGTDLASPAAYRRYGPVLLTPRRQEWPVTLASGLVMSGASLALVVTEWPGAELSRGSARTTLAAYGVAAAVVTILGVITGVRLARRLRYRTPETGRAVVRVRPADIVAASSVHAVVAASFAPSAGIANLIWGGGFAALGLLTIVQALVVRKVERDTGIVVTPEEVNWASYRWSRTPPRAEALRTWDRPPPERSAPGPAA